MGAEQFTTEIKIPKKTSDQDAFLEAVDAAGFEYGRGGYTGSIAEKGSFVRIHRARSAENAKTMVETMLDSSLDPIPVYRSSVTDIFNDKWGPAAAIRYPVDNKTDGIIFFGWAKS